MRMIAKVAHHTYLQCLPLRHYETNSRMQKRMRLNVYRTFLSRTPSSMARICGAQVPINYSLLDEWVKSDMHRAAAANEISTFNWLYLVHLTGRVHAHMRTQVVS